MPVGPVLPPPTAVPPCGPAPENRLWHPVLHFLATACGLDAACSAAVATASSSAGMDPGCRKPQRGFWLPANSSDPAAILLVESAIDASTACCWSPLGTLRNDPIRQEML